MYTGYYYYKAGAGRNGPPWDDRDVFPPPNLTDGLYRNYSVILLAVLVQPDGTGT